MWCSVCASSCGSVAAEALARQAPRLAGAARTCFGLAESDTPVCDVGYLLVIVSGMLRKRHAACCEARATRESGGGCSAHEKRGSNDEVLNDVFLAAYAWVPKAVPASVVEQHRELILACG